MPLLPCYVSDCIARRSAEMEAGGLQACGDEQNVSIQWPLKATHQLRMPQQRHINPALEKEGCRLAWWIVQFVDDQSTLLTKRCWPIRYLSRGFGHGRPR